MNKGRAAGKRLPCSEDPGQRGQERWESKASCKWMDFNAGFVLGMVGGTAGLTLGDTERGRVSGKGLQAPSLSPGQDCKRGQPEPVTLLDKDVTRHSALCGWQYPTLGRWAGLWMVRTASGDDCIAPSDHAQVKSLRRIITSGEKSGLFNRRTGGFYLRLL